MLSTFSLSIARILIVVAVVGISVSDARANSLQIVYDTPLGPDEQDARVFIDEEGISQTVSGLVNREFALRYELTLFLGGRDGPLFDESLNEIRMPYVFVYDIANRFNGDSYSSTGVNVYDVVRDAYLHALLHQISHALFVMYDLRTSGSLEKAVDALAVLLMLRYYENGGDVVLNAAELFVQEGGSSELRSGRNFWNEHDMDQQSYNQALCLVYGSDPQRYSGLEERSEFLQIRGRDCIQEYRRQTNAWFGVLRSFLKRPPPE